VGATQKQVADMEMALSLSDDYYNSIDSVKQYLSAAAEASLLTPQEEVELAKQIEMETRLRVSE
jgi:DNA-directed RNA polymerase sigma subunit (sigma70/sigma32)